MHVFHSGDTRSDFSKTSVCAKQALHVAEDRTASLALVLWINFLASLLKHRLSYKLRPGVLDVECLVGVYESLSTE